MTTSPDHETTVHQVDASTTGSEFPHFTEDSTIFGGTDGPPWKPTPDDTLVKYLGSLGAENAHELSQLLLREFGSMSDMLAGSTDRLERVVGKSISESISTSRSFLRTVLFERAKSRPVLQCSSEVLSYLRVDLSFMGHERLAALYLDRAFGLMKVVELGEGKKTLLVDAGKIIYEGLLIEAASFILVHNHPSGLATPSHDDKIATNKLHRLAADVDMPMLDHLIVARGKVWSFSGLVSDED